MDGVGTIVWKSLPFLPYHNDLTQESMQLELNQTSVAQHVRTSSWSVVTVGGRVEVERPETPDPESDSLQEELDVMRELLCLRDDFSLRVSSSSSQNEDWPSNPNANTILALNSSWKSGCASQGNRGRLSLESRTGHQCSQSLVWVARLFIYPFLFFGLCLFHLVSSGAIINFPQLVPIGVWVCSLPGATDLVCFTVHRQSRELEEGLLYPLWADFTTLVDLQVTTMSQVLEDSAGSHTLRPHLVDFQDGTNLLTSAVKWRAKAWQNQTAIENSLNEFSTDLVTLVGVASDISAHMHSAVNRYVLSVYTSELR